MGKTKSAAKQQSLRDYAGVTSAYAVIVTLLFVLLFLLPWLGIQPLAMIGGPEITARFG